MKNLPQDNKNEDDDIFDEDCPLCQMLRSEDFAETSRIESAEDMYRLADQIKRDMIDTMRKTGVRPAIIYAFDKTEFVVTEDNIDQFSGEELEEWDQAIQAYRNKPKGD